MVRHEDRPLALRNLTRRKVKVIGAQFGVQKGKLRVQFARESLHHSHVQLLSPYGPAPPFIFQFPVPSFQFPIPVPQVIVRTAKQLS